MIPSALKRLRWQPVHRFRFGGIIWADPLLWLAITAGPMVWSIMLVFQTPTADWLWPLNRPVLFLMPVLVYPVLEEIVFRGLLQDWLAGLSRRAWGALSLANVITSLCFAALHIFYQPPLWAALVFFPSLVFGYFRERHDSLGTPILLHVVYNFGAVWFFWG